MAGQSRSSILTRERAIFVGGTIALLLVVWFAVNPFASRPVRLRLSAGSAQGLRHTMARTLAKEATRQKLEITLVPTAGSEAALDQVDAGKIEIAMVQGGLDVATRTNLRQVAALHVEPLHLLVKEELLASVSENLAALRSKTVNLGEEGSGTHALSQDVLQFAGLIPTRDFVATTLSYQELQAVTDRANLPDAIFTVSLLPSPVARHLVVKHRYRVVPLPFSEAFGLDFAENRDALKKSNVSHDQVVDATIPAFTYSLHPAVPALPVRTLGTRLLLVAHKDVSPDAISRLLSTTFSTSFAHLSHPPLTEKLLELPPEMPVHPGTLVFLEQSKPVNSGEVIDSVEKELSIAGAIIGGLFFLWQFLKRRYRQRRESGFENYILKVGAIESRALEIELSADLDLKELLELQAELGRIKSEAIAKFALRELEGEDLMTGFLAHASDSRDHLTRLILHRRDQIERLARKQKRPLAELWDEAIGRSLAVPLEPSTIAPSPD